MNKVSKSVDISAHAILWDRLDQCKFDIIPQRYLEEIIKKNIYCSNSYTDYVKIKLVINSEWNQQTQNYSEVNEIATKQSEVDAIPFGSE